MEQPTMKWHKFQIYFGLWVTAVLNVGNAVLVMTGMHYGGDAKWVYMTLHGMQAVDIMYGLLALGLAAYAVFIRFQLAAMKWSGVRGLIAMYVVNLGRELIYVAAGAVVLSLNGSDGLSFLGESVGEFVPSIIGAAVGIVIHRKYYSNRRALFG